MCSSIFASLGQVGVIHGGAVAGHVCPVLFPAREELCCAGIFTLVEVLLSELVGALLGGIIGRGGQLLGRDIVGIGRLRIGVVGVAQPQVGGVIADLLCLGCWLAELLPPGRRRPQAVEEDCRKQSESSHRPDESPDDRRTIIAPEGDTGCGQHSKHEGQEEDRSVADPLPHL